jgi:hypothetical protein
MLISFIHTLHDAAFPDDMIANKWPLENRSMFFGSLWNLSIFDGINQKKDKKEDIFINSTLGSHLCQSDLNYHQNGSGPLDNETITTLSVFYLNL